MHSFRGGASKLIKKLPSGARLNTRQTGFNSL